MLSRKSKDSDVPGVQEDATGAYRVVLQSAGNNKIAVIKELRALSKPNMGLPEAKALVLAADASPQVLLRFEERSTAEDAAARFGLVGANAIVVEGDVPAAPPGAATSEADGPALWFTCPFCGTVSSGSHCDNCGAPRHVT